MDEALRIGDRIALMKDGSIVQIGTPEEIMMNPANEYVERFVEDVDWSKVLTAANVMKRPESVTIEKDGPRVALKRMRDLGISSIYVVNRLKQLVGALTAEDADRAIKQNLPIDVVMIKDVLRVKPETVLSDLLPLVAVAKIPVAVVDEDKRLKGAVIRGAVIGALSGNGVNEDGPMDE